MAFKTYQSAYTGPQMDARWGKAETALQGVIVNGTEAAKDAQGKVSINVADPGEVEAIRELIPTQASPSNKLADKDFVNSSISTNTANFLGTFNSVAAMEAYAGTKTKNDYAFVVATDAAGNTVYNRYKWTGTAFLFEYALNNSSFTASQWAAINSLMTAALAQKLDDLPTDAELAALFADKMSKVAGASDQNVAVFTNDGGLKDSGLITVGSIGSGAPLKALPTAEAVKTYVDNALAPELDKIPFVPGDGEDSAVLKGGNNEASGELSVAEGRRNSAAGFCSHSEGEFNISSNARSHTEGAYCKAEGAESHAENEGCIARGINSHAEGYYTLASGVTSHAEGASRADDPEYDPDEPAYATVEKYLEARGQRSHAEGYATQAFGEQSHAEGVDTLASGGNSHAEGSNTTASGISSHAEGYGTKASGINAHAEGLYTWAHGDYSHAEGYNNAASSYSVARGIGSHVEGFATQTTNKGEHAEGNYNKSNTGNTPDKETLHSVGIGNESTGRMNAFEIMQNGDVYIIGIGGFDGTNALDPNVLTVQQVLSQQ